jgi:hypothetical protein
MWIVHRTHEQNHLAVVITDGEEEGTIHDHLEEAGFGSGPATMRITVTAAASLPSSFTSTKAPWITPPM